MADFTENNGTFPTVTKLQAPSYAPTPPVSPDGDTNHAETFNQRFQALVNRDANLKQAIANLITSIAAVNQQITAINTALDGLTIGEEVQGYSTKLQSLSNLASVANLTSLAGLASVANLSTLAGLASVANTTSLANLTLVADKLLGVNSAGNGLSIIDKVQWAIISDVKAASTNGGTATQGSWNKRTLNTISQSPVSFVTLDSVNNVFTLPVGNYVVLGRVPAGCMDWHQARLKNNTDNTFWLGSSQQTLTLAQLSGNSYNTDSWITSVVSVTGATKQFQIETFVPTISPAQTSQTYDLGGSTGSASGEVFTQALIIKLP